MKYTLILLLIITFPAFAQQEIKIEDIKNHIGDTVKITGNIYGGKYLENVKGSPTFLNLGAAYPNAPLTIVIWKDIRSKFETAPEEFFNNKKVIVIGKLELYKDKPQIVLTNANNLFQFTGPVSPPN